MKHLNEWLWVGISEEKKKNRRKSYIWISACFVSFELVCVCVFLIKYECLNSHILMKPTVNSGTAGVFIVGLAVRNDANKERDQREDVM